MKNLKHLILILLLQQSSTIGSLLSIASTLNTASSTISSTVSNSIANVTSLTTAAIIKNVLSDFTTNFTNPDFKTLAKKYCADTVEKYEITTEDGYILTTFRIPGNVTKSVLIIHGLFSSSDDHIIRGENSTICMLVAEGYDVWAMNCRGNRYSRKHTTLNPDTDSTFWDYSMHELGYYDVPAVIDVVLNKTSQSKLSLVGYSQGTSAIFILGSTRPEYHNKTNVMVTLAPVAYFDHSGVALRTLIGFSPLIYSVLKALDIHEIINFNSVTRLLIRVICTVDTVGYDLCEKLVVSSIAGYGPENIGRDFFPLALSVTITGTSLKTLYHYGQVGLSGKFQQYDYGYAGNILKYGTINPPLYNLTSVTGNVALFVGDNDQIASVTDAERIKAELPNVVEFYNVPDRQFTHLDYIWGKNSSYVMIPQLIKILDEYI